MLEFNIAIASPNSAVKNMTLIPGVYTIGRTEDNDLCISDSQISVHHARLHLTDSTAEVEDLHSSNGTFVGNLCIGEKQSLSSGDIITLGGSVCRIDFQERNILQKKESIPEKNTSSIVNSDKPFEHNSSNYEIFISSNNKTEKIKSEVKNQIHDELLKRLDLKRLSAAQIESDDLSNRVRTTLQSIVNDVESGGKLPPGMNPKELFTEIYDETMKLGPIEKFLADDSITEIMVNGADKVFVERNGRLILTGQTFMDNDSIMSIIERIISPLGRRIDESQPYVDARLKDGSRVNAIIPPLSLIGPCITIRKFAKRILTTDDFVSYGTWTKAAADFLSICVKLRKNIVVSGGTGSGKTTLLNILSSFIPQTERILTIEDAAELRLNQTHVIKLEARPANIEGRGAVTIRDLVRNALRMRPDRIIVGECRGGEALDMLQAMNTGHDGSLTTVHANSARDVISRLETMVLMSGMDLPSRAIREQIASAVDIIVQESRMSDGSRKVVSISEIVGMEGQQVVIQEIFKFNQTGLDANGKVLGELKPTGSIPTFFEKLEKMGIATDISIFQEVN